MQQVSDIPLGVILKTLTNRHRVDDLGVSRSAIAPTPA